MTRLGDWGSARDRAELDRHITGNYGEDQFADEEEELECCQDCGEPRPCRCSTFNPPRRERPSYGVQRRVRATITKSGAPGRHEPYAELDDGRVMPMGLNGTQVIAVGTVGVAEYVTSPSYGLWHFRHRDDGVVEVGDWAHVRYSGHHLIAADEPEKDKAQPIRTACGKRFERFRIWHDPPRPWMARCKTCERSERKR